MTDLRLVNVSNSFLKSINLEIRSGDFLALVGPSGAGKTSLLRVMAGLARHAGSVYIQGLDITHLPPHRRRIGYVSQDLHLFPHLTLEGNIGIGLERLKPDKDYKRRRTHELMELLKITHLSGRKPATFSGGEKQRAALARALASGPQILLLDEPFGQLDFRTAEYLRLEFRNLREKLGLTTVLVTHNLNEAREMAGSMAVMESGAVVDHYSIQTPEKGNGSGDGFLEALNVLKLENVTAGREGLLEAGWAGERLLLLDDGEKRDRAVIRAGDVRIGAQPPPGPPINRFIGTVCAVEVKDGVVFSRVDVNGIVIRVETPREKWCGAQVGEGDVVHGFLPLRSLDLI